MTLRDNTERPITVVEGTNRVVGRVRAGIVAAAVDVLDAPRPRGGRSCGMATLVSESLTSYSAAGSALDRRRPTELAAG